MARRRLGLPPESPAPATNGGGVATAPPPPPPPAAPVTPAAPPPPARQVVVEPAAPAAPVVPVTSGDLARFQWAPDLLALFGFERPPELAHDVGQGDYMDFSHPKKGDYAEVIKALGAIPEGSVYVSIAGKIVAPAGWCFMVLQEFPYWVTLDPANKYAPNRCWLTPQPKHVPGEARGEGSKIAERILTVLLMLPGKAPIPAEFGPAVALRCEWRTAKCKAIKAHADEVERSSTPEWAKEGANGALVASVPPRARVVSSLILEQRTSQEGRAYMQADVDAGPTGMVQMKALAEWGRDEESQESLRIILDDFDNRIEEIRELAADTKAKQKP